MYFKIKAEIQGAFRGKLKKLARCATCRCKVLSVRCKEIRPLYTSHLTLYTELIEIPKQEQLYGHSF